jgi:hypothetical protein
MAWLLFIGYVCCGGLGNLFYRAYQESQESTEKKINRWITIILFALAISFFIGWFLYLITSWFDGLADNVFEALLYFFIFVAAVVYWISYYFR